MLLHLLRNLSRHGPYHATNIHSGDRLMDRYCDLSLDLYDVRYGTAMSRPLWVSTTRPSDPAGYIAIVVTDCSDRAVWPFVGWCRRIYIGHDLAGTGLSGDEIDHDWRTRLSMVPIGLS